MTPTNNKLKVQDIEISLATIDNQDYISLTDMAKGKNDEARAADIINSFKLLVRPMQRQDNANLTNENLIHQIE